MSPRTPKLTDDEERLRKTVAAMLEASRAGKLPWLDDLLEDAGYVDARRGLRQKALVEDAAVPRKTLREWEQDGAPTATVGRAKYYPIAPLIRFLVDRYTAGSPSDTKRLNELRQDILAQKLEREKHDLASSAGRLIPRKDAEADLIALAMEFRAALQALPGELSEDIKLQLTVELHDLFRDLPAASLTAPDGSPALNLHTLNGRLARVVTKALRRHIALLCRHLANGNVPVPPESAEALDRLIDAATSSPES